MNDTTVSNHATAPAIPNPSPLRSLLAFLLGTCVACLVAAFGVGVLMAIGSPDIPGEAALDLWLVPLYALLSLMFILPVVLALGVPYAALLLAFGRFRFWPMTLGGFVIAGGPALVSLSAMQLGISGSLVDTLALFGMGAGMLSGIVPYPVAGVLVGLLGALGAAAFHRAYVWIAPRQ
ncbi:hypothetical protein [Lysobacter brunescens]|uniref:Uncharacterized protein n=1 Tax=Lysobacter brunescens TaxID=262323 RepID=A0ABW2YBX5_9GAMM